MKLLICCSLHWIFFSIEFLVPKLVLSDLSKFALISNPIANCVLLPLQWMTQCKYYIVNFCVFTNQPTKYVQSTTNKVKFLYVSSADWRVMLISFNFSLKSIRIHTCVLNQMLNVQQYQLNHIIDVHRVRWALKWAAIKHFVKILMR